MDSFLLFLQERWFVLIIGFIVIMLVWKLFKALLKWIVIVAVLAAIVVYGSSYVSIAEGSPTADYLHQDAVWEDISAEQV